MATHTLLGLLYFTFIVIVGGQDSTSTALEPLASKKFTWPDIPYQVTGDQGGERGPQAGYNICNSTTEGASSMCQTSFLNDLSDFCMWSSGTPDDTVGASEAREVAWCTKPGHGTRIIPAGTITGAQWLYAKSYVMVVGFLNQANVDLDPTDEGGELDPHGADEQGNPLGGIVFSNGYGQNAAGFKSALSSNAAESTSYTQVVEWIDFIGGGIFCLKMCNPSDSNGPGLCAHVYDEVGCNYNAIADYPAINGTYTVCDSDDMAPPGVFTDPATNQLTTWFQPLNGPVTTIPYTTTIPSSSNCQTFASSDLWPAPSGTAAASSGATPVPSSSAKGVDGGTNVSGSRSGSASLAASTSTSGAASVRAFSLGVVAMSVMVVTSLFA